ncbi:hypothetical protein BU26DRAFT_524257 [Trematosphaeria pertusa]|uniref:Uncharacterized protein n=1 Tax=Trematosphaeria pertusa TaxID=390896 RepID=A0A6A6HYA0_9PLEO|nr:uncharacterized protein BU26DRAFT_524257 [Trematosphaeria pertusa]KAF2242692.1 hypothetical protein BU26DRAFT_524257 [Trematosphaeria pertusa]
MAVAGNITKPKGADEDADEDAAASPSISTSQPATTTRRNFVDLPRELRDKVYDELWKGSAIIDVHVGRLLFRVTYGRDYLRRSTLLPMWLRTSKSILHEGLEQLFRKSTWECVQLKNRRIGHTRSLLLGPSVAPNMAFLLPLLQTARPEGKLRPLDLPDLEACMRLFEGDTPIRVLHLEILYLRQPTMAVDLSFVKQIKRPVERLEVKVSEMPFTTGDPAFEATTVPALKEEVARVGALVAGKKGRLTMEKVLEPGNDKSKGAWVFVYEKERDNHPASSRRWGRVSALLSVFIPHRTGTYSR